MKDYSDQAHSGEKIICMHFHVKLNIIVIMMFFHASLQWHPSLSSSLPLHQKLVPMQMTTCKLTSIVHKSACICVINSNHFLQ